jgi:hypothetical protein
MWRLAILSKLSRPLCSQCHNHVAKLSLLDRQACELPGSRGGDDERQAQPSFGGARPCPTAVADQHDGGAGNHAEYQAVSALVTPARALLATQFLFPLAKALARDPGGVQR